MSTSGITEKKRRFLDVLNRELARPFSVVEAGRVMNLPSEKARRLLVYWEARGWLSRLRRNLYITVPLGAVNPSEYGEDPWIVAHNVFSPCYIGGWSAAEHWGLTEQIFKDVGVFTSYRFRHTRTPVKGTTYILQHIKKDDFWGLVDVWRKTVRVKVADPSRTIADILNVPVAGGGIRHVCDIVKNYFDSSHRNDALLLSYLAKIGNKTVYKRLGFIVDKAGIQANEISETCLRNISKGYSLLDPAVKQKGKIVRKWNLFVNVEIGE